jgi:hypothetical protein
LSNTYTQALDRTHYDRQFALMTKITQKFLRPSLLFGIWGVAVCAGFFSLWGYETAAGEVKSAASAWPLNVDLARDPHLPTLTMALHPGCPCSRASIAELAELMAHAQGRLTVYVLFAQPVGIAQDPATNDLWTSASAIPGVHVLRDAGGARCKTLHATISGQVFLYDADGQLQFTGGITASRGHEGDNEGLASIDAFLATGQVTRASTPVYGCTLY